MPKCFLTDRVWPMSAMLAQTTPGPNQTVNGKQRAHSQAEALETSLRACCAHPPTPRRRPAKQPETSEPPRRSCLGSRALRRSMDKSRRVDCAHPGPTEVRQPATRRRDTQVNQVIASYSSRSSSGRTHEFATRSIGVSLVVGHRSSDLTQRNMPAPDKRML